MCSTWSARLAAIPSPKLPPERHVTVYHQDLAHARQLSVDEGHFDKDGNFVSTVNATKHL